MALEELHSQSATQPQTEVWSQPMESQPITPVWGRIYGKCVKMKSMDLNSEEFTAGRGELNNLVLTLEDLPQKILCRISKVHFTITRTECDIGNPVYIKDLSRNGTFVNGELVGMNKMRILQDNDVIALSHQTYKAFVFKDLSRKEDLQLPKEIADKYYLSRKLGSGACGVVHLVYNRGTCQQYALKIVKKNMLVGTSAKSNNLNDPERLMNEANIMKNLSHPCVINMIDIVDNKEAVYMVLEFMNGGDLLNRIIKNDRLSERTSKLYFYQMCQAVKYLHDKGITHRDLKPDNVLLQTTDEETVLKVSDFGLSKFVQNDSVMQTICGTPAYVAPEILLTGGRGSYSNKVDIWSLGVVLFTCLSGTMPFSDTYGEPTLLQVKKGKYRFNHPSWNNVTSRAMDLIKQMLVVDPKRRPTIEEVLQSKWLQDDSMLRKAKSLMKINQSESEDEENFLQPPAKRRRL